MSEAPSPADDSSPQPALMLSLGKAGPTSSLGLMRWLPLLLLALVIGIGLRVGMAWSTADHAVEWEADAFVRAWEALPLSGLNHVRPPLTGWVFHQLASRLALESILELRLAGVVVSVMALGCAMLMAIALSGQTQAARRSRGFGLAWMTGIWAVLPTLFFSAPRPTGETLLGGLLCLLGAGVVAWGRRATLLTWISLALATGLALLAGGLVVALAVSVGLVVYLVPVPRVGIALPLVLALALGAGGALWLASGDTESGWASLPLDAAPAYALAELTDTPIALDDRQPLDPQRRTIAAYRVAWDGARDAGVVGVATAFSRRLVLDQLSPRRFEPLGSPMLAIGLFDVFLRGGLLLFAAATLSLLRRRGESSFPRAGMALALLMLLFLLTSAATSPFGWAPIDLVLLAVAGAGVASADPDRPAIRWLAFGVGGVMLGALGLGAGLADQPLSRWSTDLTHEAQQGRKLVEWLEHGGPDDAAGHLTAAALLMDPGAPFLRLPEAASRHTEAALELDPSSHAVLAAMVQSWVENLRLDEAEQLAGTMLDTSGELSADGRLLTSWVHEVKNRRLAAAGR